MWGSIRYVAKINFELHSVSKVLYAISNRYDREEIFYSWQN